MPISLSGNRTEALGQSEPFLEFQERLSRVAPVERSVLLLGERGTGKELAASRLHYLSRRWDGPFITLNCATLSPTLIETELFGHQKGAFTGADTARSGRFEAADGGTLFLDEIGSIPMAVQEKILRMVEYGSFERVGSSVPIEVDVRIVGATNVDLSVLAARKNFKQDLLDRLSFEVLFLPPLRYRTGDIELLAKHFALRMSYELEREIIPEFSEKALGQLASYHWPGNIRELKNVVERAVYQTDDDVIRQVVFDPFISPYNSLSDEEQVDETAGEDVRYSTAPSEGVNLREEIARLEVMRVREALEECRYNRKKAAQKLGLTYDQFRGLFRRHEKELSGEG